ncbi:hypothetical protein, partial [uncultured Bacteroides sp.]|uniref:hypothetical protein n=1 Tax=uncultured Bacteroides sp. TaxID=162156 RepID=UPI00259A07C4
YDTINIFLISILLIISIIVKCVSPVRTAKANSKLKQSSEIQGFQSFFFFSTSVKNGGLSNSCVFPYPSMVCVAVCF